MRFSVFVRCILAVACLVAALSVAPGSALAHATLLRSDPVDGTVLPGAPGDLVLTFNEPVTLLDARLFDPAGAARSLSSAPGIADAVVLPLPGMPGKGTYALRWKVVSGDGHPVGDTLVFSVREQSGEAVAASLAQGPGLAVDVLVWSAWVAMLAGLLVGCGCALFAAFAGTSWNCPTATAAALCAGLAAAPLALVGQGLDALDLPLAAIAQPAAWSAGWSTSFGTTVILAVLAMALALAAMATRPLSRPLAAAGMAAMAAALAASGHAAAASPQGVSRPSVAAHVVCAAIWVGALPVLAASLRRSPSGAAQDLARFSRAAPFAVALLAASGFVLAVLQVEAPVALVTTAYGGVLLAKLALVAALLALAGWNRWRLTRPALAGEARARRMMARLAGAELLLSLAILGIVGLWRFTPPPRVLAEAAAVPTEIHLHTAEAMAEMTITPGRRGPVSVVMTILDGEFGPLDAEAVSVAFTSPAGHRAEAAAAKPGDGTWRVDTVDVPDAGRWTVLVTIRAPRAQTFELKGTVDIRP